MTKKVKIILAVFVLIGILGFAGYNYVLHGGERNLDTEEANFTVNGKEIILEFMTDLEASNKKYLEKAVAISGTITSVRGKEVILDNSVICTMKNADSALEQDQKITIKGRVVGYDDLLSELQLDQCFINN
jgi:hypothetical protein